jgi:hypothetical protein
VKLGDNPKMGYDNGHLEPIVCESLDNGLVVQGKDTSPPYLR